MPTSRACAARWVAPSSSRTRATPRSAHGSSAAKRSTIWWPRGQAGLGAAEIEAACVEHGVPVGTAYTAADIFADPHMAARRDLVTIEDPVIGPVRQQAPFPRFVGRPAPTPAGAPELGAHNREVWCELIGLSADELERLGEAGVV